MPRNNEQTVANVPVLKCSKCGCEYFKQEIWFRVDGTHTYVLGQPHNPPLSETGFIMLKCVVCGAEKEPNVPRASNTTSSRQYDRMLDHLDECKKKLEKPEQLTLPKTGIIGEEI